MPTLGGVVLVDPATGEPYKAATAADLDALVGDKADLVSGTVPLAQVPTLPQSKITDLVTDLDAKLSSLAGIGALLTAILSGLGLDVPIAYSTAYAQGTRPAIPTNWKFRIYGGTLSDPDPTWMIAGDYRQIVSS